MTCNFMLKKEDYTPQSIVRCEDLHDQKMCDNKCSIKDWNTVIANSRHLSMSEC